MRINSFEPMIDKSTRVLILGSMPSVKSLQTHQYYGNPRNHFWPMLARLLGQELPEGYADRLQMLKNHHIGLWDVYGSCERMGSLDSDIQKEVPNDLEALLLEYPSIRVIALNGGKAAKGYQKHFAQLAVKTISLPSSSPIPTRLCKTFEDKLWIWQQDLSEDLWLDGFKDNLR